MYTIIGLPLENTIVIDKELYNISTKHNIHFNIVDIPHFALSISTCGSYEERLLILEKECEDLIKSFGMFTILKDKNNITSWDYNKYPCPNLRLLIKNIETDIASYKKIFEIKKKEFLINKQKYIELVKRQEGDLSERDLVCKHKGYEFIEEVFIVILKDDNSKFMKFINESQYASVDTLEQVDEDIKYLLYKIFILKEQKEDFIKSVQSPFIYKKIGCIINKEDIEYCKEGTSVLNIYIQSHIKDLYSILVHIKYIKLYVDSFCTYGFPTTYVFLMAQGPVNIKVIKDWNSERIIVDEEGVPCYTQMEIKDHMQE